MIRKLEFEKKQIDEVMEIWKEATIKAHSFIPQSHWIESYDKVKNDYMPISKTYVYIEDEKVLGFISILDDSFIGALFVDLKHHGKGIGRALIDHVFTVYDDLSLAVYKKNKRAIEFYKYLGFAVVSEEINEDTGEKEYIMNMKVAREVD